MKVKERRVRISPESYGMFSLHMTVGTGEKARHYDYYVSRLLDRECGFLFEKFVSDGEDDYTVEISQDDARHTCTCKGHRHHGHCKHVEALVALIDAGKVSITQPAHEPIEVY